MIDQLVGTFQEKLQLIRSYELVIIGPHFEEMHICTIGDVKFVRCVRAGNKKEISSSLATRNNRSILRTRGTRNHWRNQSQFLKTTQHKYIFTAMD